MLLQTLQMEAIVSTPVVVARRVHHLLSVTFSLILARFSSIQRTSKDRSRPCTVPRIYEGSIGSSDIDPSIHIQKAFDVCGKLQCERT